MQVLSEPSPLSRLIEESVSLFHRLRAVAAQLRGHGELSAGRRGVLRSITRLGPQSVPQLARARPVSRQHMRMLVNSLLKDGLVAAEHNPAHRRSSLIRITPKGSRELAAMKQREKALFSGMRHAVTQEDLLRSAETIRSVRQFLERKQRRK